MHGCCFRTGSSHFCFLIFFYSSTDSGHDLSLRMYVWCSLAVRWNAKGHYPGEAFGPASLPDRLVFHAWCNLASCRYVKNLVVPWVVVSLPDCLYVFPGHFVVWHRVSVEDWLFNPGTVAVLSPDLVQSLRHDIEVWHRVDLNVKRVSWEGPADLGSEPFYW